MNCPRLAVLAVALFGVIHPAVADAPTDEAKRLTGAWRGTAGVWAGKPLPPEVAQKCILTITAAQPERLVQSPQLQLSVPDKVVGYQIWSGDQLETRYTTSWHGYNLGLDPAASPKILTAFKLFGLKGHGFAGVYRLEGDTLTVCLNFDQSGKPLKEFKSPAGSQVLLLTLKRGK